MKRLFFAVCVASVVSLAVVWFTRYVLAHPVPAGQKWLFVVNFTLWCLACWMFPILPLIQHYLRTRDWLGLQMAIPVGAFVVRFSIWVLHRADTWWRWIMRKRRVHYGKRPPLVGPAVGMLAVFFIVASALVLVCWLMSATGDDYIDHAKPPMLGR